MSKVQVFEQYCYSVSLSGTAIYTCDLLPQGGGGGTEVPKTTLCLNSIFHKKIPIKIITLTY